MKHCPQCGRTYEGDYSFCLDDGALLTVPASSSQATQVLPREVPVQPRRANGAVAVIIGVLVVAVVVLATVLIMRNGSGRTDDGYQKAGADPAHTQETQNAASPPPVATPVADSMRSAPPSSPAGGWFGNWSSSSGAYLKFDLSLTEANGRVDGQINWKLLRTTRPDKMSKVGSSAVEYVSGSYDPATRLVSFAGYRKDDPNDMLVMLDQYRLTLSPDGRTLNGAARNGGKWNGKINLSR